MYGPREEVYLTNFDSNDIIYSEREAQNVVLFH